MTKYLTFIIKGTAFIVGVYIISLLLAFPSVATSDDPSIQQRYYVAPWGNDGNPGTESQPFQTVTKARDTIKTINKNMTGDIVVYLRGGTYSLTSPLVFDQNDSGTNGFNIVYQNYQNEIPVISGGKQITGWQQDGNKWKAYLGTDIKIRQLHVNGKRAIRARNAEGLPGAQLTPSGYTTIDTTMQNWKNITGVEFVLGIDNWMQHRCGVQTIAGLSITMKSPCFGLAVGYTTGNKPLVQWIENAYELLGSPGEWYHDRSTGWLSYIPRSGEEINKTLVIAPLLETLLSGSGTPDNPIHNIQFQGITFSYASWFGPETNEGFAHLQAHFISPPAVVPVPANITFSRAQSIRLERNIFTHLGGVGLSFMNGSQNNTILGNHFSDISSTALAIGNIDKSNTTDNREITKNNQITNNYIYQAAVEYQGSVGLWLGYVQNTLIAHNELHDVPYTGISIGWGWGTQDPSVAKDNKIENNLIYDHCKVLRDCGGIYSLSAQPGNVYSRNVIRNQVRDQGAIYLDNGSRYITVDSNVVYDNYRSVLLNDNGDNVLQNNYWQDRGTRSDNLPDIWVMQRSGFGPNQLNNNHVISGQNDAPSSITGSAGLETSYQDIKTIPSITPIPLPGDIDGNGKVDIFDYNLLVTDFGKTESPEFVPADIDRNDKVDIFDYNILVGNFGKSL